MSGSVLRRAYVPVEPDVTGFDDSLKEKLRRSDPGGKAGKQISGQLNRALKRLDLDPVDLKADPKSALAAIALTEHKLQEMSDNAATVEVKIRTEKALGELGRFRKTLGNVGSDEAPKAAVGFATKFSSVLESSLANLKSAPVIAGAIVAAAPLIGATIAGAVVGAAGVGGVAGGLALAAKDPRVQAEGKKLSEEVMAGLTARAEVFVAPALKGVQQVRTAWRAFDGDLQRILDSSANYVEPLVSGLTAGALKAGHGFADAVAAAGPVIDQLSRTFDQLGGAVGDFFTKMSEHADDGALAIRDLTYATVDFLNVTGDVIGTLASVYGWLDKYTSGLYGVVNGADAAGKAQRRTGEGTFAVHNAMVPAAAAADAWADALKKTALESTDVALAQDRLKAAEDAQALSLNSLGGSMSIAGRQASALATAMDNLYGAAIRQTDANEGYQASWDSLSASVRDNGRTLNIHTAAGRANRDALEGMLSASNDLYIADIAAGDSIAQATKKHKDRTAQVVKESEKLHLNKDATNDLITTYGQIPKKKQTNLLVAGVGEIVKALKDLYIFQRALADGIPIASEIAKLNEKKGPAKRFGGYAEGGWTGPGPKHRPAGIVHADEWVVPKEARRSVERQAPGFLAELTATGQVPGYARGGPVAPIDTSRGMRFVIDAGNTLVMTRAQAASKVTPAFGNWPSSPSAQRGDSGVWRRILAVTRAAGFDSPLISGYRPGDPKWHGSGRADDFGGFNQDRLAQFWAAKHPLELIHRTATRDYAYTRGVNKGSFNNALMEAHRNHVHVAMANGGVINEPVYGFGASGRSYSFGERGPETVTPGVGGNTYNINVSVPVGVHPAEAGRQIVEVIKAFESSNGSRWRKT